MDVHGMPVINPLAIAEHERSDGENVRQQLAILAYFEDQVWQALGLFNYTTDFIEALKAGGRPLGARTAKAPWYHMAATYAVLMIYNFRDALHAVRDSARRVRAFGPAINGIEEAIDEFEADFPDCKALRDNVGHFVDKIYNAAKRAKHQAADEAHFHGSVIGNDYVFFHEGRRISLTMDDVAPNKLCRIKRRVYAAFPQEKLWLIPA
ncbi:MAG: hypothetical protein ACJ8FS_17210 [Sphingomicrobium sp.]